MPRNLPIRVIGTQVGLCIRLAEHCWLTCGARSHKRCDLLHLFQIEPLGPDRGDNQAHEFSGEIRYSEHVVFHCDCDKLKASKLQAKAEDEGQMLPYRSAPINDETLVNDFVWDQSTMLKWKWHLHMNRTAMNRS